MNNLKTHIASVFGIALIYSATASEVIFLSQKKIDASFNFDRDYKLSLVVKNSSDENVLITTDIDHLIQAGLQGFPQNAALQFRTKNKKAIKLKCQNENGWFYPNIYNSKLDFQIIDGNIKDNRADSFSNLLVTNNSYILRQIDYAPVLGHVLSELRSANEFRVMWKIQINDDGIIINKEIVSDWFHYESMVLEIAEPTPVK